MMNDAPNDMAKVGNAADNPPGDPWPLLVRERARGIVRNLAATHAVAAITCYLLWARMPSSRTAEPLFGALLASQAFTLAVWTALGGKRTFLRIMLTTVGMVALMQLGYGCVRIHDFRSFLVFLMPLTAAVCAVFLVLRLLGLELKLFIDPDEPRGVFQFSLFQLMALTLTLAVCLSALKYLPEDNIYFSQKTLLLTGNCIFVGMVSVGLVFFRRWLPLRILAFPFTVILATALIRFQFYAYIQFFEVLFFFTVLSIATMISMAAVRWAGYRMTWRWRFRMARSGGRPAVP
jgi:hypothetical protein